LMWPKAGKTVMEVGVVDVAEVEGDLDGTIIVEDTMGGIIQTEGIEEVEEDSRIEDTMMEGTEVVGKISIEEEVEVVMSKIAGTIQAAMQISVDATEETQTGDLHPAAERT